MRPVPPPNSRNINGAPSSNEGSTSSGVQTPVPVRGSARGTGNMPTELSDLARLRQDVASQGPLRHRPLPAVRPLPDGPGSESGGVSGAGSPNLRQLLGAGSRGQRPQPRQVANSAAPENSFSHTGQAPNPDGANTPGRRPIGHPRIPAVRQPPTQALRQPPIPAVRQPASNAGLESSGRVDTAPRVNLRNVLGAGARSRFAPPPQVFGSAQPSIASSYDATQTQVSSAISSDSFPHNQHAINRRRDAIASFGLHEHVSQSSSSSGSFEHYLGTLNPRIDTTAGSRLNAQVFGQPANALLRVGHPTRISRVGAFLNRWTTPLHSTSS
ncbi:MAG: hypothetical protein V4695_00505 [Pseudomonadota bacterium]